MRFAVFVKRYKQKIESLVCFSHHTDPEFIFIVEVFVFKEANLINIHFILLTIYKISTLEKKDGRIEAKDSNRE